MPTRTWACYLPAEFISVMAHKDGFWFRVKGGKTISQSSMFQIIPNTAPSFNTR